MALVSPGIQISINDQSQYVNSNIGSVPLVVLATAQDKTYNGAAATGTSKANAGTLLSFSSQRDLVTQMGTPTFQVSASGTPVNGSEINEYGLMAAYSALGLTNQLFAIRADIDLNELKGTSVRPTGAVANGTDWLNLSDSEFGIYVLNSSTSTFTHVSPLLITDPTQVQNDSNYGYTVAIPKTSVGAQGSYALVFVNADGSTPNTVRLYYKTTSLALGTSAGGPGAKGFTLDTTINQVLASIIGYGASGITYVTGNYPVSGTIYGAGGSGGGTNQSDVSTSLNPRIYASAGTSGAVFFWWNY